MRSANQAYPCTVAFDGLELRLDRMGPTHEFAVLEMARSLPAHDLLFLSQDISQPEVVAAWAKAVREGRVATLLAWHDDAVVGCIAIEQEELTWSPHVGELRAIVLPQMRGKGLGRQLIQRGSVLAGELGLTKLVMQMTTDQRAAMTVFESLGFRGEALLRDHVKERDGRKHDLALLSLDVTPGTTRSVPNAAFG